MDHICLYAIHRALRLFEDMAFGGQFKGVPDYITLPV